MVLACLASIWSLVSLVWPFAYLSALIWTKAESHVEYLLWIKVWFDFCLGHTIFIWKRYISTLAVLSQKLQKQWFMLQIGWWIKVLLKRKLMNASVKVKALWNTPCVCLFELIHLLLPTVVCRLLVLYPSKFVLDKINAAVEEEQRRVQIFVDAFRADRQEERIYWLTFY